jgi:hypothetical protein
MITIEPIRLQYRLNWPKLTMLDISKKIALDHPLAERDVELT